MICTQEAGYDRQSTMTLWKTTLMAGTALLLVALAHAQPTEGQTGSATTDGRAATQPAGAPDSTPPDPPERWNLYFQATAIGDEHGTFYAPYTGPLSLQDYPEHDVSLTTTLFFTALLTTNTQLIFNPEIAGGKGFSGVSGIANPPNGELPRVATAIPKPYLARLFVAHDFAFGTDREQVESDANQLAGERPMTRSTRSSLSDAGSIRARTWLMRPVASALSTRSVNSSRSQGLRT